ncbi:response regulator [Roseobacter sp. GAI101]|uniref:response regulator n=1 Tax=Roseobacter sp. (strain GAI101) TaxID=391589 RepID=UPI0001871BFE|nr:response regulator [Roseobacter sp. GAI101]EEB86340.1 response regulator receiver domain protein [Roseobacter sp. GAI101]
MRILAVDDDPVIRDLLKGCLTEDDNYFLTCATSAEDALVMLKAAKHPFDCFLLDIMLPGVGGIELCETLRNTPGYRSTPILMITASREIGLMQRAFVVGATDFITKPLNGIELGARIKTAGLLNDSLRREEQARHRLEELTQATKIRFDERIKLDVDGVGEFLELENQLLRLQNGCYGINLFTVEIEGLRRIYRAVKPPAFRYCVTQGAEAGASSLMKQPSQLAYAGSGRFVGYQMGRRRLDFDLIAENMNLKMEKNWDAARGEVPAPPRMRIKPITDQRIWSGISASEKLRENLTAGELFPNLSFEEENNIFAKMDIVMSGED